MNIEIRKEDIINYKNIIDKDKKKLEKELDNLVNEFLQKHSVIENIDIGYSVAKNCNGDWALYFKIDYHL